MKCLMYKWVGKIKNLPAWFKHQEYAELSWDQINELYQTGNNIMLKHSEGENILFVDDRGFSQR